MKKPFLEIPGCMLYAVITGGNVQKGRSVLPVQFLGEKEAAGVCKCGTCATYGEKTIPAWWDISQPYHPNEI